MIVETVSRREISPKQLAEALAKAHPDEFAAFWMSFSKLTEGDEEKLAALGKAMSPSFGGMRKTALSAIFRYMEFYAFAEQKSVKVQE